MSDMTHSHNVTICGENFRVKSDVPSSVIVEIANYVDEKIREVGTNTVNTDKFRMAVLAAMNIAGDYFNSKSKVGEFEEKMTSIESKSKDLSDSLDLVTNSL